MTELLTATAGLSLCLIGFLMGVHSVALSGLPPHRRPRYAQRAPFRFLWTPARVLLLVSGLALCLSVSVPLALAAALALATATLRRLYVRSDAYRRRMLRDAYVDLCRQEPGVPREDLLRFLVQARHPKWDPEMIGRMIEDYPTVDGLLRALVRLERQVLE